MRPRFLQSLTTGLAIACLTLTAAAQFDAGGEQDRQNQQSQQDRSAEQRQGAESSQQVRLGTVDLKAVSEAYKKSKEDQSQARAGEGQEQGQDQEGEGLQTPAQADQPRALGQESDDSGIDEQMLNEIRDQARSVAEEEDVDLIVLEVLHENGSDVETVDLTDQVIQRIEQGDDQSDQQSDPLMGGQESEQDSENADAEEEGESNINW